jgi:hypothetical protein
MEKRGICSNLFFLNWGKIPFRDKPLQQHILIGYMSHSGEDSEQVASEEEEDEEDESDPCEEEDEEDGTVMTQAERREANIKALLSNRYVPTLAWQTLCACPSVIYI